MRGRRRVPRVALGDPPPAARSRSRSAGSRATRASAAAERVAVAGRRQQRALAVGEEAAEHVEVGGDDRQLGGERLERGQPEALLDRGEGEHVGGPVQALDRPPAPAGRARARAPPTPSSSTRASKRSSSCAVVEQRRAAGDQQQRVELAARRAQRGEALQQRERALARLDPADGQHREAVAEAGRERARSPARPRRAAAGSGACRRRCRRARRARRTRAPGGRPTAARRTGRGRARRSSAPGTRSATAR